jgi:hypothetical protein
MRREDPIEKARTILNSEPEFVWVSIKIATGRVSDELGDK